VGGCIRLVVLKTVGGRNGMRQHPKRLVTVGEVKRYSVLAGGARRSRIRFSELPFSATTFTARRTFTALSSSTIRMLVIVPETLGAELLSDFTGRLAFSFF
jgi:hypothetical protein